MKNYKEIKTEKGKKSYLEKDKYILYYSNTFKNGDKIFRCKYYRDKNLKCKAFLLFVNFWIILKLIALIIGKIKEI